MTTDSSKEPMCIIEIRKFLGKYVWVFSFNESPILSSYRPFEHLSLCKGNITYLKNLLTDIDLDSQISSFVVQSPNADVPIIQIVQCLLFKRFRIVNPKNGVIHATSNFFLRRKTIAIEIQIVIKYFSKATVAG